eukprot:2807238-Amphidinium_carterae.1
MVWLLECIVKTLRAAPQGYCRPNGTCGLSDVLLCSTSCSVSDGGGQVSVLLLFPYQHGKVILWFHLEHFEVKFAGFEVQLAATQPQVCQERWTL